MDDGNLLMEKLQNQMAQLKQGRGQVRRDEEIRRKMGGRTMRLQQRNLQTMAENQMIRPAPSAEKNQDEK